MPKVRLYGTFTEVRSTFSMPLKLVTTVVLIETRGKVTPRILLIEESTDVRRCCGPGRAAEGLQVSCWVPRSNSGHSILVSLPEQRT